MATKSKGGSKPQRGDMTGRKRVQNAEKVADEVNEQALTKTKMAAAERAAIENEVIEQDGKSSKVIDKDDPTIAAVVAAAEPQPTPGEATEVEVQGVEINETEMVLVRARYDVENATVGYGNNYNMEEGRKYRIPRNAAFHFSERELVDILSA